MNTNLLNNDTCALRNDLLTNDTVVQTHRRGLPALKTMIRLMLAFTFLLGLMASRPAHAQYLNLSIYTNTLSLTDAISKKSVTGYLGVNQDGAGNLTGWLNLNNTAYKVTGTIKWYGLSDPQWYWMDITATYSSGVLFTTTYHLSDWVYDEGAGSILFWSNSYTWNSRFGLNFSSGGGTFSGYGFETPK